MADDVFGADKPAEAGNDLSAWVGDGKKYATSDDALKSVPHAQSHIDRLKEENDKLRGQVTQLEEKGNEGSASADDVLRAILKLQEGNQAGQQTTPAALDENAVRKLVSEGMTEQTAEQQSEANQATAVAKLKEQFGDAAKAQLAVQQKAEALGQSVEWMRNLAAASPEAFILMFNDTKGSDKPDDGNKQPAHTPADNNDHHVAPPAGELTPGTHAYYQKMRREDPKRFNDPHTLEERMNALKEDRAAYFR